MCWRSQQQFSFFDESKLNKKVRFINLSDVALEKGLHAVLEEIIKQVTALDPRIVVLDSFRTLARQVKSDAADVDVQAFTHRLAQFLTSW